MMEKRIHHPDWQDSYQIVIDNTQKSGIELESNFDWQLSIDNLGFDEFGYELFLRLIFSSLVDASYLDTESHVEPETSQQRSSTTNVVEL